MARSRGEDQTPDRLAAVLEELEAVRRAPGWVPAEDTVIDEPRSRVAELPRRVATSRRQEQSDRSTVAGRHVANGRGEELRPREPLLRPPEPLIRSQVAPSRLAVIGALTLVVVAGLVFGGRVLWARAMAQPQPITSTSAAATATPASASSSTGTSARPGFGAAGATSSAPSTLVVQVVGQVHKPGVVHVKAGSRVEDAVAAAGGALPGADLAAINLARLVTDGEQIQVPKPGEQLTTAPQASAGAPGSSGGTVTPTIVDLNTADAETLDTLPGVGPVMAQRILQWRADNGRFTSIDELGEVSGIGDKMLAQLRPLVRVG
jgi:competence protein ComEA